jgi:hypothetical protein
MQLLHSNSKFEGVEWIKILENILVIVDHNKVEASTNGEWRVIICRCLSYLLDETKFSECYLRAWPSIRNFLISCASEYLRGLPTRRSCYSSLGIAQRASVGGITLAARLLRRLSGKAGKLDAV